MLPDTGSQLFSFNVVALQSMMEAIAREVAERVSLTCLTSLGQCIMCVTGYVCALIHADMCGRSNRHQASRMR